MALAVTALAVGVAGLHWSGDLWVGAAEATSARAPQPVPAVISNITAGEGDTGLSGVRDLGTFAVDAGLYVVAVASGGDAVLIINVTDPYHPQVISSVVDDGAAALGGASAVDIIRIGNGSYAVVASASDDSLQVINLTRPDDPVPLATITDNQTTALDGVVAVDTFQVGSGVYAAAVSPNDNGLQVINLTRPDDPVPLATITDNQTTALDGVVAVDTFQVGSGVYAAAVSPNDNGLQVINLTRPGDPVPLATITDNQTTALDGVVAVDTFQVGSGVYAAAVSPNDNGLQVINLTRPGDPVPLATITDNQTTALDGVVAVDTFQVGSGVYAAAVSPNDNGLQVINLTRPGDPVPLATITDNQTTALDGVVAVDTFQVGSGVYAAAVSPNDNGLQVINLTRPGDPVPLATITDNQTTALDGVVAVDTFQVGSGVYAAAVSPNDNGLQVINLTRPGDPVPLATITDNQTTALDGVVAVDTFQVGSGVYAAAVSPNDNGLQVINLTRPGDPVPLATITDNQTTALDGVVAVDTFQVGSGVYAAAVSPNDNGLQVINLTRPGDPVPLATITDNQTTALDGVVAVDTFQVGSGVYAAAVSPNDNGLQVINLTRPGDPVPLATITDNQTTALDGVVAVDTFQVGSGVYAAAVSPNDNGLQVINLTRPGDPVPLAPVPDGGMNATLRDASAVNALVMNGSIYVAAVSPNDNGLQVINLTSLDDPVPVAPVPDGGMNATLRDASAVNALVMNGSIYAAAVSPNDNGLQVINLTSLDDPVPVAPVPDGGMNATLRDASAVNALVMNGSIYVAAVSPNDNGLQVINLTSLDDPVPVAPVSDGGMNATLRDASAMDTFMMNDSIYAVVATADGIVVVDLADPASPVPVMATQNNSTAVLHGASALKTFQVAGHVYAAVVVPDEGGAIRIVSLGEVDSVPPTITSATYEPWTGLLTISFSEPLNHTATVYPDIAVAGPVHRDAMRIAMLLAFLYPDIVDGADHLYTLDETTIRTASNMTIKATLDAAQIDAVGSAPMLYMMEGAVRDVPGNPIGEVRGLGVAVLAADPPNADPPNADPPNADPPNADPPNADPPNTDPPNTDPPNTDPPNTDPPNTDPPNTDPPNTDPPNTPPPTQDTTPPRLLSSYYNTGTGVLNITFSEPLSGAAIRYDRMAVRDTGESSGGLALNAVASKTLDPSSTTITLTLLAAQRTTVNGMATPQLDIEAGAVADIAGNDISAAPDQDITVINTAPSADAGENQTVTESTIVSLNGTRSSDAEDASLSYSWTHTSGPTVTLSGATTATPSFTAPNVDQTRNIILTLTVTDSDSLTGTDTVTITVNDVPNTPPTVDAGANQTVTEGDTVSLNGTASDTDTEDTLTYAWTFNNTALGIALADASALDTTFDAPNVAADTPVLFTLTVSDGTVSRADTALVTIRDSANTPPTVDAGANQTVTEGDTVSLNGTASDTDTEDTLTYAWTFNNTALGIALQNSAALDTTFDAPNVAADTPVLFTLTVSDGTVSRADTVLVTIRDSANTPPTVNAGANQTVTEGDTVSLNGTASDTDTEDTLTYAWTFNNTALGIALADASALDTTFDAPNVAADTPVLFTLTVSDGTVSRADTVLVTIRDSANTPPTVNAGANQNVTEGDTVSLDGTASDTDTEDTLTYAWTFNNTALGIALQNSAALDTTFDAPNVAADTPVLFTLTVSDGTVSRADTVLVTIRDSANTPPTVNAGANQTVTEGDTVSLNGTASDTDTEDTLTYAWTFNNTALGIALADASALDTTFDAPNVAADTPVLFTLTVSDGTVSRADTALVTIRDSANTPPTVNAGANQNVTEGDTVSLDGTASDTDTEDTLTYAWTFNNTALGIALQNSAALDTTFDAPNVAADTPVLFTLTVSDGTVSRADTVLVTIRDSANTPPTVNAGANQTVTEGDTVSLNGTASDTDTEDTLTYAWTFNNTALGIALADASALDTTFDAPNVAADTPVLFTLTVSDGTVSRADTVLVTIRDSANTPPTVDAGANQTVTEGDTVSLNGTASDTDTEDTLTYAWTFNNTALGIALQNSAALDTTFDAPNVAADTPVLFTLTVSDGTVSRADTVLVTIRDSANTPPTVNAGANQTVTEGDTVSLNGTASDTDTEDTLTYAWTFNNTALGIALADASALDTTFDAPNVAADTPVLFTLTVSDGTVSRADTVLVTIRDSANTPPTVNAGANQNVTEGDTVSLDGTASDTDTEDTLTYAWTFNNTALGIALQNSAALDTTFDAPNVAADTPVLFTLTVSDGTVSRADTVLVTIRDSANTPPTVNAGANQTVTEGDTVSLNGTASDTDTEDTLTYAWTFNNTALGIALADASALDTTFDAPNVAADTPVLFTLTVSDGTVLTRAALQNSAALDGAWPPTPRDRPDGTGLKGRHGACDHPGQRQHASHRQCRRQPDGHRR